MSYKQKWSFSQAYALYFFHTQVHCLFLQTILAWNLKENKVWKLLKYRKPPKFTGITFIEHLRIVKNRKKFLFFYSSTPKCVFGWHLWALIGKKNKKAFSATLKMRNCICQRCNNMLLQLKRHIRIRETSLIPEGNWACENDPEIPPPLGRLDISWI